MKKYLTDLHKTAFIYFRRINEGSPNLISYLVVFLFVFVFALNIVTITSTLSCINIKIDNGKTGNLLLVILLAVIGYFLFYNVFLMEKFIDNPEISVEKQKKVWIVFIINFILFFILAIIRKQIQHWVSNSDPLVGGSPTNCAILCEMQPSQKASLLSF